MNRANEDEAVIISKEKLKFILNFADTAAKEMLEIYECMSESEQRAFDWGMTYRGVLSTLVELEDLTK